MALPFNVPADFSAATDTELAEVTQAARTAAKPLLADLANLNDEQKNDLRELSQVAVSAQAEVSARAEKAAEFSAAAGVFSAMDADDEAATAAAAAVVPAPAAEVKPTFSTAVAPVRAKDVAARTVAPRTEAVEGEVLPALKSVLNYAPRVGIDTFTNMHQLADALVDTLGGYNGFKGDFDKRTFATIKREFPADLVAPDSTSQSAEYAMLLHAGELYPQNLNQVAAAGWCAPSMTLYDLCELETVDGILQLPEIAITRGGIFFTTGPDFATIFGGTGYWNFTEAQVIANTVKPCMEIPCPPFTELRLNALGVCVTGGLLQRRGYPELVARFIRGALIAHLHRVNAFVIAQMAAGSTLVDFDPIPAGSLVGDNTSSGLLAAAEMVGVDMRYRNRMACDAMLEVVLPCWAKAQIRADMSRRTGVDLVSISDATIDRWFADRNLNVRWVYDWQDAYSGVATGPGAALPGITTFPSAVEFLIYPAGTWVKGVDDIVRLETVYDSTKLSTNQYTAIFTEEGVLVAKMCPDSRRVVYPLCPSGSTSELTARTCA
jgi:hypothetical protein